MKGLLELHDGLRRLAPLGVAALAAAPGCSTQADADACARSCRSLLTCSMLPSSLGSDADNCAARCRNSTAAGEIIRCAERVDIDSNDWCSAPSHCNDLAQCLLEIDSGAALTGETAVRLIPVEGAAQACGDVVACDGCAAGASDAAGGSSSATLCDPVAAQAYCETDGQRVSTVTAFIQTNGEYFEQEQECAAALTRGIEFDTVPVGTIKAGLVFRGADRPDQSTSTLAGTGGTNGAAGGNGGAGSSDQDGGPKCLVVTTERLSLRAGTCIGVQVALPFDAGSSALIASCEQGLQQCGDTLDNDRDGRTDCDDPKCEDVCPTTTGEP